MLIKYEESAGVFPEDFIEFNYSTLELLYKIDLGLLPVELEERYKNCLHFYSGKILIELSVESSHHTELCSLFLLSEKFKIEISNLDMDEEELYYKLYSKLYLDSYNSALRCFILYFNLVSNR